MGAVFGRRPHPGIDNTADFITNDTGATGIDDQTVNVQRLSLGPLPLLGSICPSQDPPIGFVKLFTSVPQVKQDTTTKQVHSALNEGWMYGGSFVSSIVAGTLLGYFADMWLGTDPWLVIAGIVLGSYAGFVKMWSYMKTLDDDSRDR